MEISQIVSQLLTQSQQAAQSIQNNLTANKVQSAEGMMDFQFKMFQYSCILNCTSSLVKTFKDLISSIISKL